MSNGHHSLPPSCPNCGMSVHGPYCAACGQKVVTETPTLFEFIHEYLHHYVALEGALTRSLRLLVTRPGQLTMEYLAGRRARYVKPLQLYLTLSFLFFVLFSVLRPLDFSGTDLVVNDTPPSASAKAKGVNIDIQDVSGPAGRLLVSWAEHANARLAAYQANPGPEGKRFLREVQGRLPYVVFILMPIFAALLKLAYRKRGMRYGAHLVFTLHLHAFFFLAFLLALVPVEFGGWLFLGCVAYVLMAQKRVYGGNWAGVSLRTLLLALAYFVIGMLVLAGLLAYSVAS